MNKRKKKISVRLPNKLHAMLTKALDDVEKIEAGKKKGFSINMNDFAYRRDPKGVCEVCLGASQLIGALPKGELHLNTDYDLTASTCAKVMALDSLRCGQVTGAACDLHPELVDYEKYSFYDRDVSDYHTHPKIWKLQMRLLAAELEEANL